MSYEEASHVPESCEFGGHFAHFSFVEICGTMWGYVPEVEFSFPEMPGLTRSQRARVDDDEPFSSFVSPGLLC